MDDSMKFNLELALKGYPIRTRFGHPVVLNKGVIDELSPFPSIALEYAFGRADMENDLIFNEEVRKEKT